MCNLDLKDAYLLVPMNNDDKKYLRFFFNNQLYQFNASPFGMNVSPFVFTKILRPVMAFLRKQGLVSVTYLDDILLIGASVQDCQLNLKKTVDLLTSLGFIINTKKSNFIPNKICKFLGFIINSRDWQIELPEDKRIKIQSLIINFQNKNTCRIRKLAQLVGILVAACPAIEYGWMNYKKLEQIKYKALNRSSGNYESKIMLPQDIQDDLNWWKKRVRQYKCPIRSFQYKKEIFSDVSFSGWGAFCQGEKTHGFWNKEESQMHINYLEILAAFLALKCFAAELNSCQVLLRIDNTTAIAYINEMGGVRFPQLNTITKKLWDWCECKKICVFAEYIPSKANVEADSESRITSLDTEWELNQAVYKEIIDRLGKPDIDLFATRCNEKCEKFCSWRRDPEALVVNAFTLNWSEFFWYAFPPFSLIPRIIKKIMEEKSRGIIVVPFWVSQPWFPIFNQLLIGDPIVLNASDDLLLFPCRKIRHPLASSLSLIAGVLSSGRSGGKACRRR